ncbi:MAG: hypothetical protein L0I76_30485 [Pseudonocardia sp.]|nr:hypothetical protein [Pseudonocardia sp.]
MSDLPARVDVRWSGPTTSAVSCWASREMAEHFTRLVDADDDRHQQPRRTWEFTTCQHETTRSQ